MTGNFEILKILLDKGAKDLIAKDANPFLLSARFGRKECAEMLIKNDVDITKCDAAGRSALHLASWFGHTEVVGLLLQSGAQITAIDSLGNTALHHCAWFGCRPAAQLLLAANANVNIQNNAGDTPLHIACHHQDCGIVSDLLTHGADTKIKNQLGQTPESIAENEDRSEIIELLQKRDGEQEKSNQSVMAIDKTVIHEQRALNKMLEEMVAAQDKQTNFIVGCRNRLDQQANLLVAMHQKHGEMKRTLNDVAILVRQIEAKVEGLMPRDASSRFTLSRVPAP